MISAKGTDHYVARQEGGRVCCYKVGQGRPLVFVPSGSGRSLRESADKLAHHFTCYVLDLPGYDHSDIPRSWLATRKWAIGDYSAAILEVLDILGIKECSLVGDHTGAMVALDIAAYHPERVEKLVLDSLPCWDMLRGQTVWERFYKPQLTDVASYDVPVPPLLLPWEKAREKDHGLSREEWKLNDELNRRDRRWHREHMYANAHFDVEALGPRVGVPTLLVYGERDGLRRGEQRAHEGIKGSILRVIPDCPPEGVATGGVHRFKPDEFTRLVLDFLLSPNGG